MRVLLTGPASNVEAFVGSPISTFDKDTNYIPEPLNPGLLERIERGEYDGVVCQADGSEAFDLVSRIRTRNARVPIVLVASCPDPGFESRAIRSGATWVVAGSLSATGVAENVSHVLKLKLTAEELQEGSKAEPKETVGERRAISRNRDKISPFFNCRGLIPLVVENDPQAAFQMVQAFGEAEVYAPLPIMRAAEEARAYLEGVPPFEDRNHYPLLNTLLVNLTPTALGVELIGWVRQQPTLVAIPVIVLADSAHPKDVEDAYGNLANSFLLKPGNSEELVALIRSIDHYWTRVNIGRPF